MTSIDKIKEIQAILGVDQDGVIRFDPPGETLTALRALAAAMPDHTDATIHLVKASSFADRADVEAFRRAKARGLSDQEAFRYGDNGVGRWDDDTTGEVNPMPMCALPPEMWKPRYGDPGARGKRVIVNANNRRIVCELRDTMPELRHIENGAGIDLSPAAQDALELKAPFLVPATWQWEDDANTATAQLDL